MKSFALSVACSVVVVTAVVAACSSSNDAPPANNEVDSGTAKTDTGKPPPAPPTEELSVLVGGAGQPADLSCLGGGGKDAGTMETGGDDAGPMVGDLTDVPFKVTEFGGGSGDIVVGADVDLFYANTLTGGAPDVKGKSDDKGIVTLKLPWGKYFAYRVNANAQLKTFVYIDSDPPTSTDKPYELIAITESKYNQFALAITNKTGFLTAAGKGIYSGRVKDCQGRDMKNAVVELVDESGAPLPTGPSDTDMKPVHYLSDGELPSDRTFTSYSGLIAVINVPETKGSAKIKAVAKGLFGGSKTLAKFAEVELEITASAVNFRTIQTK